MQRAFRMAGLARSQGTHEPIVGGPVLRGRWARRRCRHRHAAGNALEQLDDVANPGRNDAGAYQSANLAVTGPQIAAPRVDPRIGSREAAAAVSEQHRALPSPRLEQTAGAFEQDPDRS